MAAHGLSAGAAAGIAVAVVVIFLAFGGVLVWLWVKRRRARRAAEAGPNFASNRGSSAGMTSTPRTGEMSETRYYMGAANPLEPTKRRSTLMPVDPRLDPFAKGIYNWTENKSHDSVNTIRDEQDYSRRIQEPPRVLRAVNPDSDID
jgi:cell wall integrity and stress response component